eukprot:37901-Chlamydomonas_euryale.AAC.6
MLQRRPSFGNYRGYVTRGLANTASGAQHLEHLGHLKHLGPGDLFTWVASQEFGPTFAVNVQLLPLASSLTSAGTAAW